MTHLTQATFSLPSDAVLVTHTDLQGHITYANEAFVEATGLAYEDILGHAHNIVRHPDVPAQLYADLWATISDGRPWHQVLLNRRKNGDGFWVSANITPIITAGSITGYLSVKTPATAAQISQAQACYQAIASGKLRLHHGQPRSLLKQINPLAHWNPLITIIPATALAIITEISALTLDMRPGWLNNLVIVATLISTLHVMYFIKRIRHAINAVDEISNEHLTADINTHGENAAGTLNRRIKTLQTRLSAQKDQIVTAAHRSSRLEAGLENLNANIMLADQNGTITYFNESLKRYLRVLEPKIRQDVPDFELNKLMGKSTGCLFKNDLHILDAVFSLTDMQLFKFEFFGAQVQLQMTPVMDAHGHKLGIVIEWQDIFQEIYVQNSIKQLVLDANMGKLHSRVDSDQLSGFYRDLSDDINGLMNNLQTTLKDITILIGGLSSGDLTLQAQAQHSGQYGWTITNLTTGINALRHSFCKVTNQASEVTQSAEHVSRSNDLLSSSIQNQARELQNTSTAMRQLTQQVGQTAEQAHHSNTLAQQTEAQIGHSNQSMQDAILAMQDIRDVSNQITSIVTLIDSIAFQTNLLALNAAVEAARAGEHGRGFAVVASEVRNLAQKSADAARNIKTLIDTTAQKIEQGTQKVQTTGDTLNSIIHQVHEMTENIAAISSNAQQQSAQIIEVNHSIHALEKAASQNATLVLENASLAEYLGDVANSMDDLVGRFILGDCEQDSTAKHQDTLQNLVLVVDDNISNQKVAVMMLNKLGYATKVASNGHEAITQCNRYHPMAILMDIEMPSLNGLEATKRLRQQGYTQPIIAYTGHSDDFEQPIKEAGMNATVHKPLKPADLQTCLLALHCKPNPQNAQTEQVRRDAKIASSNTAQQYAQMIAGHLGWKKKIRSFIDGADIGVTYESAIDHTACALGKWYYQGDGRALMHLPLMQSLGQEHMEMHQLIKVVMDAFSLDDYQTLENAIAKMDTQSDKVVALLNELIDNE